ncbi:MAG: M23 family metallopeptidase [Ardenticatenaceae bacterium]|nr:M23 family metallopeptidase [Ardenticatenaceae bacterium]
MEFLINGAETIRPLPTKPDLIKNATPFTTLPFDPSAYPEGWGAQGFGDTNFVWNNRMYSDFGYLHPGVDIPMAEGTELLALGEGVVWCGGGETTFCGQGSKSGGHGISILYEACGCIVIYVHAENVLAEGTHVSAGDVVGVSGKSPILEWNGTEYVITGYYEHLHLEVRNTSETMA